MTACILESSAGEL